MEFVKCYQDLCREIEIYEMRLESLIAQKDAIVDGWLKPISDISGIDYAAPRVQENHCKLDLAEQLPRIEALEKDIEKYQLLLDKVKECQRTIENRINNMDGIEYKIAYMRVIEGKNLKKIAKELNYSYGYVRQVCMRVT
jgi:DNA repair ATPase RecN